MTMFVMKLSEPDEDRYFIVDAKDLHTAKHIVLAYSFTEVCSVVEVDYKRFIGEFDGCVEVITS